MPFNGAGLFQRVYNWAVDAANSVPISAPEMDTEMDGFATGLSNCMTRDGQGKPIADISMNDFRLTSVANAVVGTDAVNLTQMQNYLSAKLNPALPSPELHGAIGNGVADDTVPWNDGLAEQDGSTLFGTPGAVYKITAPLIVPNDIILDGRGATLKPYGDILLFANTNIIPSATVPIADEATVRVGIASGATIGSRTIIVSSAAGLVVGQRTQVRSNNAPTEEDNDYPASWSKITNIVGTTVTIEEPLLFTYLGTVTLRAYSSMRGRVIFKNFTIDLSATTYTASLVLGSAINLNTYEMVIFENIKLIGMNNTARTIVPIGTYNCVKVITDKLEAIDNIGVSGIVDHRFSATVSHSDINLSGSHFGANDSSCGKITYFGGSIFGRKSEDSTRSIRAIKSQGSGCLHVIGTVFNDYETAIKNQDTMLLIVDGLVSYNGGDTPGSGGGCISVSSETQPGRNKSAHIISADIYNYGGYPVLIFDQNSYCTVDKLTVIECAQSAFYTNGKTARISQIFVTNWDKNLDDVPAVLFDSAGYAHSIDNAEFYNLSTTTAPCIKSNSNNTHFGLNISCQTANPLYDPASVQPVITEDSANRQVEVSGVVASYRQDGATTKISHIGKPYAFPMTLGQRAGFTMAAGALEFSISDSGGNYAGKFFADVAATGITIVSDVSSHFQITSTGAPAPAAGKVGVYKAAGSSTILFYNNVGGVNFQVQAIGQVVSTTDPF